MNNRRKFIKNIALASAAFPLAKVIGACTPPKVVQQPKADFIWANLMHLSYNMWVDHDPDGISFAEARKIKSCTDTYLWAYKYHPYLTCDKDVWDDILASTATSGMNMVILDLGDGVKYKSHPEIAVEGAWSISALKTELKKIRSMGLEPIPKLNFSAGHKAWLGPHQRMVSSKKYYEVCKNLIDEVHDIFEKPRLFHIGMDEEDYANQKFHHNVVVRQNDLWWNDLYYLQNILEKKNTQAWVWSDYVWAHPDLFFKKMPKSILQSNWYYRNAFKPDIKEVKYYHELEKHGYDQVPTGSNHSTDQNFQLTVDYCTKIIDPTRLKGFMQSVWRPTLQQCRQKHLEAVAQAKEAIRKYKK